MDYRTAGGEVSLRWSQACKGPVATVGQYGCFQAIVVQVSSVASKAARAGDVQRSRCC
jgi:hypothetical protein